MRGIGRCGALIRPMVTCCDRVLIEIKTERRVTLARLRCEVSKGMALISCADENDPRASFVRKTAEAVESDLYRRDV